MRSRHSAEGPAHWRTCLTYRRRISPGRPSHPGELPRTHVFHHASLEVQCNGDDPPEEEPDALPQELGPQGVIPRLALLAKYGRSALSSLISSWWRYWSRHRTIPSFTDPLVKAVREGTELEPTGLLLDWLRSLSWTGTILSPEEAGRWLGTARRERATRRREALSPWHTRPTAARPKLAAQLYIGRLLYKRKTQMSGVRCPDGTWAEDPGAFDKVLWDSQGPLWGTAPPLQGRALQLIRAFVAQLRHAEFPLTPAPTWGRTASVVLGPSGSAPGPDAEPNEVYHVGVRYVSCLLAQGLYLANDNPDSLAPFLGQAIDLLV